MNFESLGDRMKFYEGDFTNKRFMPLCPIIVRLDGVGFHNYTKGMPRPYHSPLSLCMHDVTHKLVNETQAILGYTQSDEISLLLYSDDIKSQVYFDGKFQKIISVLASKATLFFVQNADFLGLPLSANFDCRAFTVPNLWEACNYFIWREQDAVRNSISMAAQSVYSHKELQNKSCPNMQDMLMEKGINWNDYPSFFKRGYYCGKHVVDNLPILTTISNLPEVIFDGAIPIPKSMDLNNEV